MTPELPQAAAGYMHGCNQELEEGALLFTADQMHAFYRQGFAAGMERAAVIADKQAASVRRSNSYRGMVSEAGEFAAEMVDTVGAAIRAAKETT